MLFASSWGCADARPSCSCACSTPCSRCGRHPPCSAADDAPAPPSPPQATDAAVAAAAAVPLLAVAASSVAQAHKMLLSSCILKPRSCAALAPACAASHGAAGAAGVPARAHDAYNTLASSWALNCPKWGVEASTSRASSSSRPHAAGGHRLSAQAQFASWRGPYCASRPEVWRKSSSQRSSSSPGGGGAAARGRPAACASPRPAPLPLPSSSGGVALRTSSWARWVAAALVWMAFREPSCLRTSTCNSCQERVRLIKEVRPAADGNGSGAAPLRPPVLRVLASAAPLPAAVLLLLRLLPL